MSGKVWNIKCTQCGIITPHEEYQVMDKESATIMVCLVCGCWRRPNNPGGWSEPAKIIPPVKPYPGGLELQTGKDKTIQEIELWLKRPIPQEIIHG